MRARILVIAAVAAALVLGAPLAAHAAASHTASLAGGVAQVTFDGEAANAGRTATVEIVKLGAQYTAPAAGDIVYLNQYVLDAAGAVSFSAAIPSGGLGDYVLAVRIAGAPARYLVSLDPAGPPVPQDPVQDGGSGGAGSDDGAGGPAASGQQGLLAATGVQLLAGITLATAIAALIAGGVLLIVRRRRGATPA
jgi:hypothetical protein